MLNLHSILKTTGLLGSFISLPLFPNLKNRKVGIFMYHSISDHQWKHSVSPYEFRKQMNYLKKNFEIISLFDAYEYILEKRIINKQSIVVTFDDVYKDTIKNAVPVLKDLNIKATFFLTTNLSKLDALKQLDRPSTEDLRELSSSDLFSIESHGHNHLNMTSLSPLDSEREIIESIFVIDSIVNKKPSFFAYPFGYRNENIINILKKYFSGACGIGEGHVGSGANIFALKRIQVDKTMSFIQFKLRTTLALDVNRIIVDFVRNIWKKITK